MSQECEDPTTADWPWWLAYVVCFLGLAGYLVTLFSAGTPPAFIGRIVILAPLALVVIHLIVLCARGDFKPRESIPPQTLKARLIALSILFALAGILVIAYFAEGVCLIPAGGGGGLLLAGLIETSLAKTKRKSAD